MSTTTPARSSRSTARGSWLSQRFLEARVHALDAEHRPLRTVPVGEEILGAWRGPANGCISRYGSARDRGRCRIAYIEPHAAEPALVFAAQAPFAAVSLALDGDRLWTNDARAGEIVAFALPA